MKTATVRVTYTYELDMVDSLIDSFKSEFKFSDEAKEDEYEAAQELAFWYFAEHGYHLDDEHVFRHFSHLEGAPEYDDIEIEKLEEN